ncbi:MAG: hypothetical protein ABII18_01745 [bacterium]|nr:hypothetical protein [bacterium]MBU1918523.1 hypothetical protein [bacterium]
MAGLDEFVYDIIKPQLNPDEQLISIGHITTEGPKFARFLEKFYFIAATTKRLLLIQTKKTKSNELQPLNKGMEFIPYKKIKKTRIVTTEQSKRLIIELNNGYERQFIIAPDSKGLKEQDKFYTEYPSWLDEQIKTGAFKMVTSRFFEEEIEAPGLLAPFGLFFLFLLFLTLTSAAGYGAFKFYKSAEMGASFVEEAQLDAMRFSDMSEQAEMNVSFWEEDAAQSLKLSYMLGAVGIALALLSLVVFLTWFYKNKALRASYCEQEDV